MFSVRQSSCPLLVADTLVRLLLIPKLHGGKPGGVEFVFCGHASGTPTA